MNDDEDSKLEDKETFRQFIGRHLYQTFFELIRERYASFLYTAVILIIMILQLIAYIYYRKIGYPFDDNLYSSIAWFLDLLRIFPAVETTENKTLYLTLMFGIGVFFLLYIGQLVYVAYSVAVGKFYFTFPIQLLRNMSSILLWVLIIPITEILISIFACTNGHHRVMVNDECWSGSHIFYCIYSVFVFIVFLIISTLIAVLYNEFQPDSKDNLKRSDMNLELYLLFYRVFVAIMSVLGTHESFRWILSIIHVTGGLVLVVQYFSYLPFYNSYTSIIYGSCVCGYLWVAFNLLITMIFESMYYTGQSVVIIAGLFLLVPLVKRTRESFILGLLFEQQHDKLSSDYYVDIYIREVLTELKREGTDEVKNMILLGFINTHKNECTNPECPLNRKSVVSNVRNNTRFKSDIVNLKDPILILHVVNAMYRFHVRKHNATATIRISFSHFLFSDIKNIHMALLELNATDRVNTTFQQKFAIYRTRRYIEEYLKDHYHCVGKEALKQSFESLDLTIVISFENLYTKLLKNIEKSATEHIEFWNHLDSLIPDLNTLNEIGLNIIDYNKETEDVWIKLIKINSNYKKALVNYGNYLTNIRSNDEEGMEYIDKAKGLIAIMSRDEGVSDYDIMFADNTAIVIISGSRENQGRILKTNMGVTNLFQYNATELIGNDVSILTPQIIGAKHQKLLDRYFQRGKGDTINHEMVMFGIQRSGYAIPTSIIVKPVPSLKENIQYIGLMHEKKGDYHYMITDEYGKIDSISEELGIMLKLSPAVLRDNELYIHLLCPELINLTTTPEGKLVTKFDTFQGGQDLTFILPDNLLRILQNFVKNHTVHEGESEGDENNTIENTVDKGTEGSLLCHGEENKGKTKIPKIVKKLWHMLRGSAYEGKLTLEKNILKEFIDYSKAEQRWLWRTEITSRTFGSNLVKLKVVQIQKDKNQDEVSFRSLDKPHSNNKPLDESKTIEQLKDPEDRQDNINKDKCEATSPDKNKRKEIINNAVISSTQDLNQIKGKGTFAIDEDYKVLPKFMRSANLPTFSQKNKQLFELTLIKHNNTAKDSQEPPGSSLNSSVVNDLNVSRLEEKPLIMDITREGKVEDLGNTRIESKHFQDQYLKKGNNVGGYNEQEDIIRNYFKNDNNDNKFPEGTKTGEQKFANKKVDKIEKPDDDSGSVASGTKFILRRLKALRNAVYDDYSPGSISQMHYTVAVIFLILIIITFISFFVNKSLYNSIELNIKNIAYSRERSLSLTSVAGSVRSLLLINEDARDSGIPLIDVENSRNSIDYYKDGYRELSDNPMTYTQWIYRNLHTYAIRLKLAQNELSVRKVGISSKDMEAVNPSKIEITYGSSTETATRFFVDCWSGIMALVTHSLRIYQLDIKDIKEANPSVYYLLDNNFNSILSSIENSTISLIDNINRDTNRSKTVLLILLIVASISIAVSLVIILRVVFKTSKNKEDILVLFTEIPSKNIKMQLKQCRKCLNELRDDHRGQIEQEFEEEEMKETKEEVKEEKKESEDTEELLNADKPKKTKGEVKKFKPYTTEIFGILLRFIIFIAIIEGYFLLTHFTSSSFLTSSLGLKNELAELTDKKNMNSFLYTAIQKLIATNGKGSIINKAVGEYVTDQIARMLERQEILLKVHSKNIERNCKEYNSFFRVLMYQDLCNLLFFNDENELNDCYAYPNLNRGLHTANVVYLDYLRRLVNEFLAMNEARTDQDLQDFFSREQLIMNERISNRYFMYSYNILQDKLEDNLEKRFAKESKLMLILFTCYLVMLVLIYFVVWRIFVESIRRSLWITKCMLAMIPISTMLEVRKITNFLQQSSGSLFVGLR